MDLITNDKKKEILRNFDYKFYLFFYPKIKNEIKLPNTSKSQKKKFIKLMVINSYLKNGYYEGKLKNKDMLIDNFDYYFYSNFYPDIVNLYKNDPEGAYNHYIKMGN